MKTTNKIGHCVECDSEDLDYSVSDSAGDALFIPYYCNSCAESGGEWYELTYVESISNK